MPAPPSPAVYYKKSRGCSLTSPSPGSLSLERLFLHCQKSLIKFPVVLPSDKDRSPPFPCFSDLGCSCVGIKEPTSGCAPPPLMARKGVATPSAAALLLRVTPSARCLLQDDRTQPSLRPPVPSLLPDLAPHYPSPKFPPGTLTCFSVYFNLPRPTTALWLALPVNTWSPTFLGTPTYTTVYFNFPLPAL